jgi:tetratricopeptide (TPR) repeat protein
MTLSVGNTMSLRFFSEFAAGILTARDNDAFRQEVLRELPALPKAILDPVQALLDGLSQKDAEAAQVAAEEFLLLDFPSFPADPKREIITGRALFLCLKTAVEVDEDIYPNLVIPPMSPFCRFFGEFGTHEELSPIFGYPFLVTDRFFAAVYDPLVNSEYVNDEFLSAHSEQVKGFLVTAQYPVWAESPTGRDFLDKLMRHWLNHLAEFLRHHRERPFLALLDLILHLLERTPELETSLASLRELLALARFGLPSGVGAEPLSLPRCLMAAKDRAVPESASFRRLLEAAWNSGIKGMTGKLPAGPEGEPESEPEVLTTDFVLRAALEEVIGDGQISDEEKAVLRNLRDSLEISVEDYQRLSEETMQRFRSGQVKKLNRDFAPEPFLFRVMRRTIQDGRIDAQEKEIIKKTCSALMIDRATVEECLKRAIAAGPEPKGGESGVPDGFGADFPALQEVRQQYQGDEGVVRALLDSGKGRALRERLTLVFADIQESCLRDKNPVQADAALNTVAVVNFLHDPGISSRPLLGVFINGKSADVVRLQFKGTRYEVFFREDVTGGESPRVAEPPGSSLRLFNRTLDRDVRLSKVILETPVTEFLNGVESASGEYFLALVHLESSLPIKVVAQKGFVEATGRLAAAVMDRQENRLESAMTRLGELQEQFPGIFGVSYHLGVCCQAAQRESRNDAPPAAKTMEHFRRELELDPDSEQSMLCIGLAYQERGNPEKALEWLEKALAISPFSLPILAAYVDILRHLPDSLNHAKAQPEYVFQFVSRAYQVDPDHVLTKKILDGFSPESRNCLLAQCRLLAVDSSIQ